MGGFLQSIIVFFIAPALLLLQIILIVYMIFGWLVAFNVVNLRNPIMGQIYSLCASIVEPILTPIRRFIPPLGGFDMAFLVFFFILVWARGYLVPVMYNALG